MHKEVFLFNGFKVISAEEEHANKGKGKDDNINPNEFLIKSLPYSKKTVFTVDDFMELV